jgi:hypothetical protein
LIPIGEQRVRVQLPAATRAKSVRLLVAGRAAEFQQSGGWLETTVPSVLAHEVVAIDV